MLTGWMDRQMDNNEGMKEEEETGLFLKGTRSLE